MLESGHFCLYPFVHLFQLLGPLSFQFDAGVGMDATSSLVLNDIRHVLHFAKDIILQVRPEGSEFHFENTVNKIWAILFCLAFV